MSCSSLFAVGLSFPSVVITVSCISSCVTRNGNKASDFYFSMLLSCRNPYLGNLFLLSKPNYCWYRDDHRDRDYRRRSRSRSRGRYERVRHREDRDRLPRSRRSQSRSYSGSPSYGKDTGRGRRYFFTITVYCSEFFWCIVYKFVY